MTDRARLSYVDGSPFARAARILVQEWDLPVTCQELPFPPPDDLFDQTPFGQVPVLDTGAQVLFPTLPIVNWMAQRAGCSARLYDPQRDLQLMLTICQLGDAIVAAYYQNWAGLEPVSPNKLGFDPAQRHLLRAGQTIRWLDTRLTPAISPPWVTFACLMLWAQDRGNFDWRAHSQFGDAVDSTAARASFRATAPQSWE